MDDPHAWDDFAPEYARVQRESRLPVERDVTQALATQLPLRDWSVLDVAAGSGRYALPLANASARITLNDWSPAMLQEAKAWLDQHGVRNAAYQTGNWHELPRRPLADLVFVSQLPTLTPKDLTHLRQLAGRAMAFNLQTAQTTALVTQMATVLNTTPVPVPQADPARASRIQRALILKGIRVMHQDFTYTLSDTATVTELLPAFDRAFSLSAARQLAAAVIGVPDPNLPVTTTISYTYSLLTCRL
ncbi:class I SAM-dependent methyltransferase [Lacticaseibacillus parakribbianus]|uniref:class I SAM-dependent methyltransferase n=1 Tax=Lacticaseibacillus parakribbianus TaxID=2970927 RepID=UPI0021CB3D5F|nr:class I SAM-dependent methyltransferase [Lacticaseibacillus parakribbianus]